MTLLSLPIVFDAVARASVVLVLTALVAAALRRASASARHFVWTLGLLSALAVPALSVALPGWEIPIVRVRGAAPAPVSNTWLPPSGGSADRLRQGFGESAEALRAKAEGGSYRMAGVTAGPAASAGSVPQITTRGGASIPWRAILFFAWLAGASLILGRMLLGLAAVLWMSRRTPIVTDAPWLAQAHALARGLGLSRVRFLRTGGSTMPMAWGIFRSSVVIPADADRRPPHRPRP